MVFYDILSPAIRGLMEGRINFILGYGIRFVITSLTVVFIEPLNRRGAVKTEIDWAMSSFALK